MTYTDRDLDSAVKAGAISAASATNLREFVARERSTSIADEEQFRLLTGFNDIFVSIATVLMLAALIQFGHIFGAALVASASWALAEFFTRKRRMALPSIILVLSFVGAAFAAGVFFANSLLGNGDPGSFEQGKEIGAALAIVAAYLHWRRFKVPITVAVGVAAGVALATLLIGGLLGDRQGGWLIPFLFATGIGVFALALHWDASDRARTTRRSDVAFWLHLLASPLLVHPAFWWLGLLELGNASTAIGRACAGMGIYVVLAAVAVAIDRRALLVSALIYVMYAMSTLLRAAGSVDASQALTALVVGSLLLFLSVFWGGVRRAVVGRLPVRVQELLPAA